MPDYKAMYFSLMNTITDAITLLQQAQIDAEDAFISDDDEPLVELLDLKKKNERDISQG